MKAAVVMYSKVHGVRKLTSRCSYYHEGSASCEIIFIESLFEQCSKKHGNILGGWGGTCNELSCGSAFPYAPIRQIFRLLTQQITWLHPSAIRQETDVLPQTSSWATWLWDEVLCEHCSCGAFGTKSYLQRQRSHRGPKSSEVEAHH